MKIKTILKGLLVYIGISLVRSDCDSFECPDGCCRNSVGACARQCGQNENLEKWKIWHYPSGDFNNPIELCLSESGAINHIQNHEGDVYEICEPA